MLKRTFDLLGSLFGLILLLPFFLIITLIIRLDSSGPVFYLQQRVGRKGVEFMLFKFRTMHVDADKLQAITVGKRDPRITRFGYYLRKYKIDEFPQMINVLKGDMSFVGPRPELKKFVDLYDHEQARVLLVRPGLTDLASIAFRNENEMLEGKPDPVNFYIEHIMPVKLRMNLEYINKQSFISDLKILLLTFSAILKGK